MSDPNTDQFTFYCPGMPVDEQPQSEVNVNSELLDQLTAEHRAIKHRMIDMDKTTDEFKELQRKRHNLTQHIYKVRKTRDHQIKPYSRSAIEPSEDDESTIGLLAKERERLRQRIRQIKSRSLPTRIESKKRAYKARMAMKIITQINDLSKLPWNTTVRMSGRTASQQIDILRAKLKKYEINHE